MTVEQQTLDGLVPPIPDTKETLEGTVDSVIFSREDGGFTVFRMKPLHQNSRITVTAETAAPLLGQQVKLLGTWVQHPRFGQQFKAVSLHIEAPSSVEGIERFLSSGAIDGIGSALAHRITEHFGKDTMKILEEHPHRLKEVTGIGQKKLETIITSFKSQSELRDIMLWLEVHGISSTFAARIYKKYSSSSLTMLEHHPYQLAREVEGIGFLTADAIAKSIGIEGDDAARIEAGVDYVLSKIATSGHCCMPEDPLAEKTAELLGVDTRRIRTILADALKRKHLSAEDVGAETLIYPPYLYRAEKAVAKKLLRLKNKAKCIDPAEDPFDLVHGWEQAGGMELAKAQKEAVAGAILHGIFVLTGGPGTGKTTVIRAMLDLLEAEGSSILLGAPTGRAAKRLQEATGRKAVTIHRLLEAQGVGGELIFMKNEDEPLEADVVILDEVSMMDVVLLDNFLKAVADGTHVIFVGDVDQLPAVGPGAVLKDILASGVVPSVCLTEVFRQAGESTIVFNAHAINAGRLPVTAHEGDFQFWEIRDAETTARKIVSLCANYLPKQGLSPLYDVQVLSPMHRQPCGVDNLNRLLQEAINPPNLTKSEFRSATMIFREGDKVMQMKNDYQKQVFNGDIGFITSLSPDGIAVRFSEETVKYEKQELGELTLAYAMSVHKSQGSEYPVVVMPLVPGHRIMLQRNLLYTAVTRAKKTVILLGSRAALNAAVENDRTKKRYTLLAQRLYHGN